MELRDELQKLNMDKLSKIHKILGLDEEYPYSDYECKGDYILHIFEKDEKEILNALAEVTSKK